ncbi:hypothetical protein, partial [Isoptericola sp. NPDC060257]
GPAAGPAAPPPAGGGGYVVDQVASLTDVSALQWHERLVRQG